MKPIWEKEASWIWTPDWLGDDEEGVGKFVYFRKTIDLPEGAYSCKARISADSRYRLFVNGQSASTGPCKGDRYTWYYETVEIGHLLAPGSNAIAVQVLRYPYAGGGNESVWRTRLPGLYMHAEIRDEQGKIANLHTDDSWLCLKDDSISLTQGIYTQFLGISETVDGRRKPRDWEMPVCRSDGWRNAAPHVFNANLRELNPWQLTERPIPAMFEIPRKFRHVSRLLGAGQNEAEWMQLAGKNRPLTIPAHASVTVDLDAGELTTGYLRLSMSGGSGAVVKLLCAECYENEPIQIPWLRDKGDRTDSKRGDLYGDVDEYRVAGNGDPSSPENYEPFWFRTFRYVRIVIETQDEALHMRDISYRETGFPLNVAGEYSSSDPEQAVLWDISVRTLRRCMHETYEDCPYYEQLQYAMDTRSQILFTYYLSGDDRLARKTFYDFHSSLLPQGLTLSRYPSISPQVIPSFSLYWVLMLHDHMMFAGDRALIERYLPSVDAVLGYFHRVRDNRGLVGQMDPNHWAFVDWAHGWKNNAGVPLAANHGPMTVYSLMYAYTLQLASELAGYAGRSGLAEEYSARAEQMRLSVKEHCMSLRHPGCLADGPGYEAFSQHSQVWAVLSGTLKGDEARHAMEVSLADPSFEICSFAMAFYLFRALAMVDRYDKVDELLEPWRKMAADGLTTWMEDTVSQRSDAHAWGSVPIYEFAAESLGIQPLSPGCSVIGISPRIGQLQYAEGKVMTVKGVVEVAWKLDGNRFRLSASWPEDVPCVIRLPDGQTIRLEGEGMFVTEIGLA